MQVIGLTGSFGSGCTYVAEEILSKLGYWRLSLSTVLREEYESRHGSSNASRRDLQAFGDELRQAHGHEWLAKKILEKTSAIDSAQAGWVIDSIRNPAEVHCLRDHLSSFFLFGVYATRDRRWSRVQRIYSGNQRDFDEDDERDAGRQSEKCGQRVEDCFTEADVVFANDQDFASPGNEPFTELERKVRAYVDLISNPLSRRQPAQYESLMASAYTISQRSSCLKRKVGAVIVDAEGTIISSGFNEVPRNDRPCAKEYGMCGRARDWKKLESLLRDKFGTESGEQHMLLEEVRREFRMLDHCRALHAEENAIVSLARNGRSVPLRECTLFTTTYPCRLCANKIVNLGIGRVIYLEPYPDPQAKVILKEGNVKDEFFEGITFKAYSRIYGEKK